jgi:hypothetical protein
MNNNLIKESIKTFFSIIQVLFWFLLYVYCSMAFICWDFGSNLWHDIEPSFWIIPRFVIAIATTFVLREIFISRTPFKHS